MYITNWSRSEALLERSKKVIPGGISSNVRATAKPQPLFFDHAEGALLTDADGNTYIDYVLGQGPMILGHSYTPVLDAVNEAMRRGQLYAGQHTLEIDVAEALVRLIPSAEMCRFSVSGSEAVQAAMRLARAVTGRKKILKFEGHYHGWFDNVLLNVAPPVDDDTPRNHLPTHLSTNGQSESVLNDYVVLPWNDLALVEALFEEMGDEIAAIMTEPMMCNTGAILPQPGFLQGLRRICDEYGALLFLDEIITGFRLGLGGAQTRFDVTPDLATFAKAMAGGFTSAALVGKAEYMQRFADDVNHSGTFNSNIISMAATKAAIAELERDDGAIYKKMNEIGTLLMDGIQEIAQRRQAPLHVQGVPTAFHLSFTELDHITDYRDYALRCDKQRYENFAVAMLRRGIRLIGRGIWYISAAHTVDYVERTLAAVEESLDEVMS